MAVEDKWKANQAKVLFMKQFPGLFTTWEQALGKTLEAVTPLPSKPGAAVLVFQDGAFTVAPPPAPEPAELKEGLTTARRALEPKHPGAYAEYDRLAGIDKEATRSARLENILGAIHNNLEQIPELKDRLRELVKQWK
jgi:diglucosylglycerate octanoyltransferase